MEEQQAHQNATYAIQNAQNEAEESIANASGDRLEAPGKSHNDHANGHDAQEGDAELHDLRIGSKHGIQLLGNGEEGNDDQCGNCHIAGQGVPQGLAHALGLPGTQVLADHGTAGTVDTLDKHIHELLDLVADAVGGGRHQTVDVDVGLDPEHGALHGEGTHQLGQTQLQDLAQGFPVNAEELSAHLKVEGLPVLIHKVEGGDTGADLAQHGGNGSAGCFHAENDHEEQVREDIDGGGDGYEDKGALAFAHAPQNAGDGVVAKDEGYTQCCDKHVASCLIPCFLGAVHQPEDGAIAHECQHCYSDGNGHHQCQQGADGFFQTLLILCTGNLGDVNLTAGGEGHGNGGHQIDQLAAGSHTDGAGGADEFTDDHQIDGGIELLYQVGQHHGDGEGQQQRENGACGEVTAHTFCWCQKNTSFRNNLLSALGEQLAGLPSAGEEIGAADNGGAEAGQSIAVEEADNAHVQSVGKEEADAQAEDHAVQQTTDEIQLGMSAAGYNGAKAALEGRNGKNNNVDMQVGDTKLDDICIAGKDAEGLTGQDQGNECGNAGKDCHESHGGKDYFFDTVDLFCTKVLTDHCPGTAVDTHGDDINQFLHLVADGVGGGSDKTKGIDMAGTDNLCAVDQRRLGGQGDAQLQQHFQMFIMDLQTLNGEVQPQIIFLFVKEDQCSSKGGDLSNDSGDGGTGCFHSEYHD